MTRQFQRNQRQPAHFHQVPRRRGMGERQYKKTDKKGIRCAL